jgi:TP901 family phage tail tape measure protein
VSNLQKTIDIILNGEDKASRQIRQVDDRLGGLNTRFAGVAKQGAKVAAVIAAVGAGITALVGAGLKEAYDQAVDFESAMVDLEKVLGSHPGKLETAQTAAMNLSNQYGVSSKEIVESIAGWVQAGYDIDEATQLAEESIALLYTSELDAAQATETLTKIMKGFGLEVDDARSKLDVANEISNNYASSVGQLTEAMGRVAPIADAMGLSFEEMSSFLVPAIEKFQDGQKVGTAFAKILNNLVSDTSRVADGLETLGVAQTDSNGELRDGRDILYDVAEAFQNLEPSQKTFVAQQIAGAEHSAKFLATMNSYDKAGAVYETAINSAGSVTEELQAKLDSAEKQLDRWNEAWTNLSVVIGDQFKIAATEAVEGGTDIVNALQTSVDEGALDPFFSMLNELAEGLSEELEAIAEAMPEAMEGVDWDPLADSIRSVGEAFGGLFDDLDLTTLEGLAEAIQRVVDTGSGLIEFFGTSVEIATPFAKIVLDIVDNVNDLADSFLGLDGPLDLFASALSVPLKIAENLLKTFNKIPGVPLDDAVKDIEDLGDWLRSVGDDAEGAKDEVVDIHEAITGIPSDVALLMQVDDKGTIKETEDGIDGLPEEKDTDVKVDDKGSAEKTKDKIEDKVPAEKEMEIKASLDEAELEAETAKIEAIAETAQGYFQMKAEIDTTALESATEGLMSYMDNQSEIMQSQIEWEAKLEIAQVEAEAKKVEAAFTSLNTVFESSADVIGSMAEAMPDVGPLAQLDLRKGIERELDLREEALEQQKKLINAEVALMEARSSRMSSDEPLITVNGDGLQPELEAFMFKILETVQMQVAEEEQEFLLGIGG